MRDAPFIVLEGIDGAGTTTQTARLAAALRARGDSVRTTREPSDGPIGVLIRQVLTGRLVLPGERSEPLGWETMAALFAADRLDHVAAEIAPALRERTVVISDRYDASSVAYQGVTAGDDSVFAWILALNARARRPDLTVVLDVSPEVALARRTARAGRAEIYDDPALQSRLAGFYRDIERHFPNDRVVHVNGDADADAVHRAVLAAVEALDARA
ncbi:MAG: dTMP kinase [Polyangiales bacterium]